MIYQLHLKQKYGTTHRKWYTNLTMINTYSHLLNFIPVSQIDLCN
jgi:hypothetical protein